MNSVLNVYRTYFPDPPGGLQEAIRQICLATSKLGVSNTIYTLSPNPIPNIVDYDEARVIRNKSWFAPASCDIGGLSSVKSFIELASKNNIVHYFYPWPYADLLHFLSRPKNPTVMTYISDVVRQKYLGTLYTPLMWSTLKKMDVIVANCPSYVETSPILSSPEIRHKVRVIPLGIDESSYPKQGDNNIFQKIGIQSSDSYFLFLGVLRYYKGLQYLVSASKNLNSKIVIAGSGPERNALEKQIHLEGIKNIIFAGQVTDAEKVSLLRNCKALILPSHLRSEAYGMVLVEASMFSKPMITCEIGTGTSFVNIHNETGLVVSPQSSNELQAAIDLINSDSSLANEFGVNARKRYDKLFSSLALGQAYKDVYDSLN
jgi:glycosyltransferase involved in cell wall biosynthesis